MIVSRTLLFCVASMLFFECLLVSASNKDSQKVHEKSKTEGTKKLHKGDASPKKHASSESSDKDSDDYDTSQGYPILFPETHMMSLKRNQTNTNKSVNSTQHGRNTSRGSGADSSGNMNVGEGYRGDGGAGETFANDSYTPQRNSSNNNTCNSSAAVDEEHGKCSKTLDLLFLLDSSESVKYTNWKIIMEFVKDLCNRFHLNTTRVAFIRFASEAEISIPLTQFNSTEQRDTAIDNIFYKTGGTRTDIALKKAMEVFHIGEQRSQVVMLITDGPTNRLEINKDHFVEGKDLVAAPAERLKETGIALFCIGIEPDSETPEEIETMKEEMSMIASEPTKQHLFISDGYHELQRKVDSVARAACVVNGGWSSWSEFSPCSVTCGYGTNVRMRTCTNPSPENNGADCSGPRVELEECDLGPCKIQTISPIVSPVISPVTSPLKNKDIATDTSESPDAFTSQNTSPSRADFTAQQNILSNVTISPSNSANLSITPLSYVTTQSTATVYTEKNESLNNQVNSSTFSPSSAQRNLTEQVNPKNTSSVNQVDTQAIKYTNTTADIPTVIVTGFPTNPVNTSSGISHSTIEGACVDVMEAVALNDTQYFASSVYSHDTDDDYVKREYAPPNARLNNEINGGSWCAEHKNSITDNKNQYLQFDLGKQTPIDGVATQGSHLLDNWVKKYNLRYSDDGKSWQFYAKNPLLGNSDQNGIQKNILQPRINARYVQINPIEWYEGNGNEADKHDICMRAALFKCKNFRQSASVKRDYITTAEGAPTARSFFVDNKHGRRGVIITERNWAHFPGQKTHLTYLSVRNKRNTREKSTSKARHDNEFVSSGQSHEHYHRKGHKRILSRIRKIAKNIMKKIKYKVKQT